MSEIELRYYQAEVTPAVVKYFRSSKGKHGLVALPTGSGKTYCIADLIQHCLKHWNTNVVVLSHVKEILEQNHASLEKYLDMEVGVNSSMMGRRECKQVTVAGIQSVFRTPEMFKDHNLVIVDEAHLINTEEGTMYQKFFSGIGKHVCVGFTATPFRLGSGYIYGEEDSMFDDLVVDWTSKSKYNRLVDDGFLSKLTTKRTKLEMDTKGIKLIGGDFNEKELAERFDVQTVTNKAIKEVLAAGKSRKKWMIFAIDIEHAEHIAEMLIRNGIPAAVVHSKMHERGFDRNKVIEDFKNGKYRCVVNVNILTTGFDDPGIDLIAMLRPTNSPVLHVQTFGRGSRISEDKSDCLILDFAGNTNRLGPINDVVIRKKRKSKGDGEAITKTCPDCDSILPPAVKFCPDCGHKFKFEHKLTASASSADVVSDGRCHWLYVDYVAYETNRKLAAPSSVKVVYYCGDIDVSEWVCVEHTGFAKHKANHWIKYRGGKPCNKVEDFLLQSDILKTPSKILVQKKGRYMTIKNAEFNEEN